MILFNLILMAYLVLFGASWIAFAIHVFKAEKYFKFGLDVSMLLYTVFVFGKSYFAI